jgi:hypothetical protein
MNALTNLLSKEVSRKEFFWKSLLILIAITGISGFLKNFSEITNDRQQKGFGSGPYGK